MRIKVRKSAEQLNAPVLAARATEYPSIVEFMDAFYWRERGDPAPMEAYLAKVDAVKAKFPKVK